MKACRFLSVLIVAVALDLAVPIAPTPAGVEFEEDEEVLHLGGGIRIAKPTAATARRPETTPEARQHTRMPAARVAVARSTDFDITQLARSSPVDVSTSPASSGEDH
jgi:hypothetical protein